MITEALRNKTENTKKIIRESKLEPKEKDRWVELMDFALENCNGRSQAEKIQGIAELLLEHSQILAERRIFEVDNIENQRVINEMLVKMTEINKVQQNQQTMIKSLHDNMEKLYQLSALIEQTNARLDSLEQRSALQEKANDDQVTAIYTKTSDEILQIRNEINTIRTESSANHNALIERIDKYTKQLSEYDQAQDKRIDDRFDKIENDNREDRKILNDKLDELNKQYVEVNTHLSKDPESWKGVVTRLFTPRTTIIIIIVVIIACISNPELITNILNFLH